MGLFFGPFRQWIGTEKNCDGSCNAFCEGTCNGRSDVTMMVLAMAPARVPSVYLVLKYARTLVMARVRVSAMDQK